MPSLGIGPWLLAYAIWSGYWAGICWFVATEKARNPGWGWAGLFFGPFAFLPLAVAPDLTEYEAGVLTPGGLGGRMKAQKKRAAEEDPP